MAARIDDFGTPKAYNHFVVGWAHAMDTPYQWTKQVASHWGGTRNGMIVHWPRGIAARGEIRSQFHHVIDVAPTVLEAAGLPQPTAVDGVAQQPIEGVSMAYLLDGATEDDRHQTQYFEMFCNRGIYHQGWTAVTQPQRAVGANLLAAVLGRRLGALRHEYGLEPGARPRRRDAGEAGRAATALARGGPQVQRPPTTGASSASTPNSSAARSCKGELTVALRRHGTPQREQHPQHQEQVPCGHGGGRRARSGAPRA